MEQWRDISTIFNFGHKQKWIVSLTHPPPYPWGKNHPTHFTGGSVISELVSSVREEVTTCSFRESSGDLQSTAHRYADRALYVAYILLKIQPETPQLKTDILSPTNISGNTERKKTMLSQPINILRMDNVSRYILCMASRVTTASLWTL
jgi:hypothetical protein